MTQQAANPRWPLAVIFDLDGVLVDTAELHYQSWQRLADEEGIPFDRGAYEQLRGLGRPESLKIMLAERFSRLSETERDSLLARKNEYYLDLLQGMSGADLLTGVADLLDVLRGAGVRCAVASSSRNVGIVLDKLGIVGRFDAVVDANIVPVSKPDPQIFLRAAEAIGMHPTDCVVVEDAEAGVEAGRRANMIVIGVGPPGALGGRISFWMICAD